MTITIDTKRLKLNCFAAFYQQMDSFAQFGPTYRRIEECYVLRGSQAGLTVLTKIRAADVDLSKYVDLLPPCFDIGAHERLFLVLKSTVSILPSWMPPFTLECIPW